MTDATPHFIPLNADSQGDTEDVLFYNPDASLGAIYNCATGRIQAVINLLNNLYAHSSDEPLSLQAVSVVSSLLLNDAYSLLETLNPHAIKKRLERDKQ